MLCQLSALILGLSIYGILRGCVMHIHSQRSNNSLQTMEVNGNFQPHFLQKWVVGEYHSCGLEDYLSPYKVNIFIGGLSRSICPVFGIKCTEVM